MSLPELPRGCDELQATTPSDSAFRLDAHLDCLPGLGPERAFTLKKIAGVHNPAPLDEGMPDAHESVLGLQDLLRTRTQGFYTLHPRVQQIVPVGALDTLLETVMKRLDRRLDFAAYQYPQYVLECRGAAPDPTALHPPEYHIGTLETLRELRANDIVTTVCRPGESVPSHDTIRAALASMETRGEDPHAVFTLLMDETSPSPSPILAFHDETAPARCPDSEQLFSLVTHARDQYGVNIDVRTLSDLSFEAQDN